MYKPVAMRPITLVTCLTSLFCVLVPSSQQQNNFLTDNRLARKGNDFITGLSSLGTKVDCYDRCYDAYLSNRNDVTGCICSQYDFHGRNKILNCNCPQGTLCEQTFGGRTCIPRGDIGGAIIGGGKYGSGPIPDYSKLSGPLASNKELCGEVVNNCRAKSLGFNIVYKFTFDHIQQTCVRILVYATCISGNLFDTPLECSRVCDGGKAY